MSRVFLPQDGLGYAPNSPFYIVIQTRMIRCLPEAQVESLQVERAELYRSKFSFALSWMIGAPARRTNLFANGTAQEELLLMRSYLH